MVAEQVSDQGSCVCSVAGDMTPQQVGKNLGVALRSKPR